MMRKYFILLFLLASQIAMGQYREITKLRQTIPIAKNNIAKINELNRLGYLYYFNRIDSCYYFAAEARLLAEKVNYKKGIADAYRVNGVALTGENNYLAAKHFSQALAIYKDINDKEDESLALINISNLLYIDNDSTRAFDYARQAYAISQKLPRDSANAIVILNIIYHRYTASKFKGMSYNTLLNRGLKIANKYHDEHTVLGYRQVQGDFMWHEKKYQQAIDFTKTSLAIADSTDNTYSKINLYDELGNWLADKDAATSAKYYQQALKYTLEHKYNFLAELEAKNLYNYYYSVHQDTTALAYAAIVINADEKIKADLKKSGFDALNYAEQEHQLKLANAREKFTTRILLLIIALLCFVYRLYLVSKRDLWTEHNLREKTKKYNLELEEQNNFNNMLISVLAHDLRLSPSATKIDPELPDFARTAPTDHELKETMAALKDNPLKSIELLEGLLHWVKLKAGNFNYQPQLLPLHDLITAANELYKQEQRKKAITFSNEIPGHQTLTADKHMLLFINRTLISNATKYAPNKGLIKVYATIANGEIIIAFENSGSGITAKQIANLFMVDDKQQLTGTAIKGAGIALSICYDMLLQMNGRLWVDSEVNAFTRFYYALPY